MEAGGRFIEIRTLLDADKDENIVGVFRSQMGFPPERAAALRAFAESLVKNKVRYDLRGLFKYEEKKTKHEEELQELLERDYGKVASKAQLEQTPYFCSALAVACYTAAGVISDTAQLLYRADTFSPPDLYEEPTFGWFLGYIKPDDQTIPSDDPLMNMTSWKDIPADQ